MAITHDWSIVQIRTRPEKPQIVNFFDIRLTSTNSETGATETSDVEVGMAPCQLNPDGSYTWYDEFPGFVPYSQLTEEKAWEWIRERETLKKHEIRHEEALTPAAAPTPSLPWA